MSDALLFLGIFIGCSVVLGVSLRGLEGLEGMLKRAWRRFKPSK